MQAQTGTGLVAAEPFTATAGALHGTAGGSGWAGAWQVQNNSTAVPGYNIAVQSPLTSTSITTTGGYGVGGSGWQTSGRVFDTTAGSFGTLGQTLYFGLLMRKDRDTDDEMWVALHNGTNPAWFVNGSNVAVGHFGGSSNAGSVRYWSIRVNGIVFRSNEPITVGTTAFLVVKLEYATTNTVSLFVNPPASALPATPSVQTSTTSPLGFQSLAFYGGADSGQCSIDELRLSGSYGALTGGSVPAPNTPTNVVATPGDSQITLSWDVTPGASGYQIYSVPASGVPTLYSAVNTNSTIITGLTNRTSYTYYIVATNSAGASAPSARVTAVPRGPAPLAQPSLGTNLSVLADWAREWPFVDAFRTARPWISQIRGGAWGQGGPLAVDANGWITSLQSNQYAETIMFDNALNDHESYPTGQYTVLYDGSGTIEFDLGSATIVSQTAGRMVVNVPGGTNGIYLMVTATNPANPIRNIRLIMPGFESTYQTQPFHPKFLERLANYKVIRFMEWMLTNGSTVREWTDRPTPGDYTYIWRGAPLETMIQLANALNANPWFNIPANASDDYVAKFATLVSQQLKPTLKCYIEYSNETWNTTFSQTTYVRQQGQALGFSTDPVVAGAAFTAYRSVQIFSKFQAAFGGSTTRMVRVLASHADNSWLSDQMLGFQNAFASADVLAIAPYFNCSDTATGGFGVLGDPATAAQVAAMSLTQIGDIQLQHINGCAMQQMTSNSAVARKYGIRMVAYEGGQSLVGYGGAENNSTLTTLFSDANRNSRMNPLYTTYLQNWINAGGDLFVHFTDVSPNNKWGNFGSLEYQDQDPLTAPKYQALMTFAAQHP